MDDKKHAFTKDYDFLQNEEFIRWRLFQAPELQDYWKKFLLDNPHLEKAFREAIKQFDTIEINHYLIPKEEKKEIYTTVSLKIKRYKMHRLLLRVSSVAAIFILALLSILYITLIKEDTILNNIMIVGHTLPNEEIHIISSGQKTNIISQSNIGLTAQGKILITDSTNTKKELLLAKSETNTLVVPFGKRTSLTLSDGTKVWLNSGSSIEFPTNFSRKNREIRLTSGEIYIEVATNKQKPFYVHTSDFNVRVYGTKFNVSAYADTPKSVVLVEGSVSLQSANNKELFLNPNEQARFAETGLLTTQKVNVNQFISWKDGYLEFDDTPIQDVLKQIGRYYNISFNYDKKASLKEHTCTGKVILSDNLDNVMTTLALISSTTYRKEDRLIYITINPNKTLMPMEK